jgi:hypothetical protein
MTPDSVCAVLAQLPIGARVDFLCKLPLRLLRETADQTYAVDYPDAHGARSLAIAIAATF